MRLAKRRLLPILALGLIVTLWIASGADDIPRAIAAEQGVAGYVLDEHDLPIADAELRLFVNDETEPIYITHSQIDGAYLLLLPDAGGVRQVRVEINRAHFQPYIWSPDSAQLKILLDAGSFLVNDFHLARRVTLSFWITTLVFIGMLVLIVMDKLHNTLAALLGVAVILSVSLVGGAFIPDLTILNFEQALRHVDFDVIFLLLGMMIVIGVVEETGIFQWLAFQAFRLARGRVWLLAVILMLISFVASALLDNVVTMLLMIPITLQIALVLGINPMSLLMPALLSSNVGGMATLVGTPVNIIIGSYAGFAFNDFIAHITLGTLLIETGLIAFCLLVYRKDHHIGARKQSPRLLKKLEEDSRIRDVPKMRKALAVFGGMLLLFIFGEQAHLPPPVAAIIGAVVMLLWVHPHIEQMMGVVDWTTLIFFIALFMVIGAVQEVGLLVYIGDALAQLVGSNLLLATLATVWLSMALSGVVDNIPFAAAMLPVVGLLARIVPGAADNNILFWALVIGANLGGNTTLIGSSANLVVKGISERAGYPISFRDFMKIGLPASIVTTALGCIWLLLHFQ